VFRAGAGSARKHCRHLEFEDTVEAGRQRILVVDVGESALGTAKDGAAADVRMVLRTWGERVNPTRESG